MEAMLKHAQDVLRMEAEAILELVPRVDENFAAAVIDFRLSGPYRYYWYG